MNWLNSFSKKLIHSFMVALAFAVLAVVLFISNKAFAQSFSEIKGWKYLPLNEKVWLEFNEQTSKADWGRFSNLVELYSLRKDELSLGEREELLAQYCKAHEWWGCLFVLSKNIAAQFPGSASAQQAWIDLELLSLKEISDEEELMRLANKGNFTEVPESVLGFLYFQVGLDNMRKGLNEWVAASFNAIPSESPWKVKLELLTLLKQLNSKKLNEAIRALELLEGRAKQWPRFANRIALQRARLLFEEKRMAEAEQIYSGYLFEGRDTAKVMLERAWIRYFDKDYSVALGMLESLKAPYFSVGQSPEQFVLSMLSYKDLCHYPSVTETAKAFEDKYFETLEHIKKNLPLHSNNELMWMVLQKPQFAPLADLVSHIRRNSKQIRDDKNLTDAIKANLLAKLKAAEADIKKRMEKKLEPELQSQADRLFEIQEQVKLIDYVSSLDAFRTKKAFEQRSYKTEKIEKIAVEKLYWPVEKEYWWKELTQFRVLISDRCNVVGGTQ